MTGVSIPVSGTNARGHVGGVAVGLQEWIVRNADPSFRRATSWRFGAASELPGRAPPAEGGLFCAEIGDDEVRVDRTPTAHQATMGRPYSSVVGGAWPTVFQPETRPVTRLAYPIARYRPPLWVPAGGSQPLRSLCPPSRPAPAAGGVNASAVIPPSCSGHMPAQGCKKQRASNVATNGRE